MPESALTHEAMARLIEGLAHPPPGSRAHPVDTRLFLSGARLAAARASLALGRRGRGRSRFVSAHLRAWAEVTANLANWERIAEPLALPARERVLIAGWHFPELPRVFSALRDQHALLLVSQHPPWLAPLMRAGCTADLHARDGGRAIAAAIASGRIIGAMLDHAYAGTTTISATLLGRTVPMASGLLSRCLERGYSVAVLGVRDAHVAVIDHFAPRGLTPETAVARIHRVFEAEIRRAPERWLMWPSLPANAS